MRKRWAIGLVAAVVVVGLVVARRHELIRFGLEQAAGLASGYSVRIDDQRIGSRHAALLGVHIARAGQPVLDARRIDVYYSLRDLLPGSTRRFGLVGIAIAGAKVTVVRGRDGSYNIAMPSSAAPALPFPERTNRVPIRFTLSLHDAQLELREPTAYDASAKDIVVHRFNVDASIDTATRTHYRATGAFRERRDEPFTIVGTIDALRGYAMHRARAARFPMRALANFFSDTPAIRILAGRARNFDARLYSFDVRPNLPVAYHVGLQLDIDGGKLALSVLAAPVDAIRGHLELVDNVFFMNGLRASLAGIPLHASGGIFDLDGHATGQPQLRLGVYGTGNLALLRHAFTFTRNEPVSGTMQLGVLVEGPLDNPLILARGHALHAVYRAMPLDAIDVGIVYRDNVVALAPLHAYYGGTEIGVRGTLDVSKKAVASELALHVRGSADRLPYLDEMLGHEPVLVDAVATGSDLLFRVRGAAASALGTGRLAALIALDPDGTASVAPVWIHTERGDLDGGYLLDRPHDTSAFWAIADNLVLRNPRYTAFPGLTLPGLPKIDGRAVGLTIAGTGAGKNVAIAGIVFAKSANLGGVAFDRVNASFAGTLAHAAVNLLQATGPWGQFDGNGAFSTQTFVARGLYAGTLDGLQPFLGNALPGHGGISGPVAIAVEPNRIVVQASNLVLHNATLHGVPLTRASVTLAVRGNVVQVYSAHARAAGGDVVAAGTYGAKTGALALIADRLNAAQLHGIGLPLDAGRLSASGALRAGAPLPSYAGGVTIARGRVQRFAIAGNGDVLMSGDGVGLQRVIGALGTTYAYVDGHIGTITSGAPTYALDATVPAGGIASALATLALPNYLTDGTFNARLRVAGRGVSPTVNGRIGVPGGAVNGLPFIDASAQLDASTAGVGMHHGRVLVGTTEAHFTAVAQPQENAVRVNAAHADLADFNNFFDTGDTLAGRGLVKVALYQRGDRTTTAGDIKLRAFRYRNLPIGDTSAKWSSARNVVTGSLAIAGNEGRLQGHGRIDLARARALQTVLARSRYDVTATASALDLSFWTAALGFPTLPITGHASGQASVLGRYPALSLHGRARIDGGTIGPLTLDLATIAVHSVGSRMVIDNAELDTPGLTATAAGSLGLRSQDPLDLQVHAATNDLPRLVYQLARTKIPVSGSFESTLQIQGTYKAPTFVAGVDATGVQAYGIAIPSLFGEVRLRGRTVVLSNAGATFAKGDATIAGSLPLELAPFRVGPADLPVSVDIGVTDLDPAIFDAVLGHHTKLGGLVNGHLGVSGTVRAPVIVGTASLKGGSYVSDIERAPISQATATLAFNRTFASIDRAFARLGSGTIAGGGRVEFPSGFGSTSGLSFVVKGVAKGAQLNLPAYGAGTIDADIALTKTPAAPALLSGNATLSNATLPFAAFITAAQGGSGGAPPPFALAFDLHAIAGKNVRVRGNGYGAGLDIGAAGAVDLSGTLAAPTLGGSFRSSGGTLTYFDRAFRVEQGRVQFTPSAGVIPTIHAVATTSVVNPDPNRARNPYGSATVTINVNGSIENLKIDFSSDPAGYSRDQIIALIAPFGGFINGIAFNNPSALQVQQINGITPLGALSPLPNVNGPSTSSSLTLGQEAFNLLNAQFTAGLLAPIETAIGHGLGLSSVNLTLGYYGNVGFTATRVLGKAVSAVYATTFGIPTVQSFGLQIQPTPDTSATLSFFYQTGPTRLFQVPGTAIGSNQQGLLGQPLLGTSGFSFTLQRYFK